MKALAAAVTLVLAQAALAHDAAPRQPWKVSAVNRARVEYTDWFDPGNIPVGREDDYTYFANLLRVSIAKSSKKRDSVIELSAPALLGLPDDAIAPGAKGQLGLGATYVAGSAGRDAAVFLKQAFVTFKDFDDRHLALRLGRFEFVEGQEALSGDPVIDFLKKDRIAHRLIGNFGFTHIQRSFDGMLLTHDEGRRQATLFAAMPTVGVFDLDGDETLDDVQVAYGAYNWKGAKDAADGRLFAIVYDDERTALKTDNRALRARQADPLDISLAMVGGHWVRRFGDFDVLAWGVAQGGDWGLLDHEAWAWSLEGGYQWSRARWKPWVRAGVCRSSGDDNPADGKHETYFMVLPTPRIYARFPFYNMMNLTDAFVTVMLKPHADVAVRFDYQHLDLTEANDLWYLGGGAFQRGSFGFVGRPSGGFVTLGDMIDASVDWKLSPRTSVTLYQSYVDGGRVQRSVYPDGANASFGYAEVTTRF